jgi:hypothetical protein
MRRSSNSSVHATPSERAYPISTPQTRPPQTRTLVPSFGMVSIGCQLLTFLLPLNALRTHPNLVDSVFGSVLAALRWRFALVLFAVAWGVVPLTSG